MVKNTQPRDARGRFVPRNPPDDEKSDDSSVPTEASLSTPNVPSVIQSAPQSTGRVGDNVEALMSSEGDPLASQQVNELLTVYEVVGLYNKKWEHTLRPRNKQGQVMSPSAYQASTAMDDIAQRLEDTLTLVDPITKVQDGGAKSESDDSSDTDTESAFQPEGQEVDDALQVANDVLRSKRLCQLQDLKEARDAINNVSNTRRVLEDFKKKHQNIKEVTACPFSRLEWKHIGDMGVQNLQVSVGNVPQRILQILDLKFSDKCLSETFSEFWDWLTQKTDFVGLFKEILETVGELPEARARMLTDHIIIRLVIFLKKNLSLVPLLYLELTLSTASDESEHVIIEYREKATFITGSVDYAIISSVSVAEELKKTVFESEVKKLIKKSTLDNILKQNKNLVAQFEDMNHFKFTIIEEKRKDYTGDKLTGCVPQVIGEALAILKKTRRKSVPRCISNGEEWLFGILRQDQEGLQNFQLPVLTPQAVSMEEDLKLLFKNLIIWTAIPDSLIIDYFQR